MAKKTKNSIFLIKIKPQLAQLTNDPPEGKDWLHEVKYDGYRVICYIQRGNVKILTRNGLDWTDKFPLLEKQLKTLPVKDAILDGELVVFDKGGISRFQLLQNAIKSPTLSKSVIATFFDMPYYNGIKLLQTSLIERKKLLAKAFKAWKAKHPNVHLTSYIQGQGKLTYQNACKHNLEGIISKKMDSIYLQKRDLNWQKSKCSRRQEFVIVGFTKPKGSRQYIGALLLGYYTAQKKLVYVGKVGTGFSEKNLKDLYEHFKPLIQSQSSVKQLQSIKTQKDVVWLKPELLCEVEFLEWTEDESLRHPTFLGLRLDKEAKEVRKEMPKSTLDKIKTKLTENTIIGGVKITHPDKKFSQTKTVSKETIARYYDKISDWILPYVIKRPLSLLRVSTSSKDKPFFQKHFYSSFPNSILPIDMDSGNKKDQYLMIKDKKGLLSLVQFDVLEIHPWGSLAKNPEKPDQIIFDLDPDPGVAWKKVIQAAGFLKDELETLSLKSFVKTSGGKGLHIVVPITPHLNWEEIKLFSHIVALNLVTKYPQDFTATAIKAKRSHKIFIDYLRNARGATTVAAYSTRARTEAPISVPLTWKELSKTKSGADFTLANIEKRLKNLKTDPWKGFFQCQQKIPKKMLKAIGF